MANKVKMDTFLDELIHRVKLRRNKHQLLLYTDYNYQKILNVSKCYIKH